MDSSRWRRDAGTAWPWRITRDALVMPARVAPTSCSSSRSLPTASRTSASERWSRPTCSARSRMEPRSSPWVMVHTTSAAATWAAMAAVATRNDGSSRPDASSPGRQQRDGRGQLSAYPQGDGAAVQNDPDQRRRSQDHRDGEEPMRDGSGRRRAEPASGPASWPRTASDPRRAAQQGGVAGHVDPLGHQRQEAEDQQDHQQGHAGQRAPELPRRPRDGDDRGRARRPAPARRSATRSAGRRSRRPAPHWQTRQWK